MMNKHSYVPFIHHCKGNHMKLIRNYSVGLRIHCADRKKAFRSQAKIPSSKAILHGLLPVTVRVLNSYVNSL